MAAVLDFGQQRGGRSSGRVAGYRDRLWHIRIVADLTLGLERVVTTACLKLKC